MELELGNFRVSAGTPTLLTDRHTSTTLNIRQENDVAIISGGNQSMALSQWGPLMDQLDRLDCAAVFDGRSIFGTLTEIDAYLLALRTDEMRRLRCHRLAVVKSDDPLPDLEFFIASARNFGLEIESFNSVDDATAWAARSQCTELQHSL